MNQKFRLEKSTEYTNDLKKKIDKLSAEFKSAYSSSKHLTIANQTLSSISFIGGSITAALAIVVVGIPIAVGAGVFSAVTGVSSAVVSTFGKRKSKTAIICRKQMAILQQAANDINVIVSFGIDGGNYEISNVDFKRISDIYSKALRDVSLETSTDLAKINEFIALDYEIREKEKKETI